MLTNKNFSLMLAALILNACSAEEPSFITQSLGKYYVEVSEDPAAIGKQGVSYSVEDGASDHAVPSDDEEFLLDDDIDDTAASDAKGQGGDGKAKSDDATGKGSDDAQSDDQGGNGGGGKGSGGAKPSRGDADTNDANSKVAKSCAPHFRGIGSKIVVLEAGNEDQSVVISPDTIVAVHVRGNQQKFLLNLGASSGMAGLCLILTGNQSYVNISSASNVQKLVYIGRGNQSEGAIAMTDGSSIETARIELSGNAANLEISGVDAELCGSAKLKGNSPTLKCGN